VPNPPTRWPTDSHGHTYRKQKQNAVCGLTKKKKGKIQWWVERGVERVLGETHESENEHDAWPSCIHTFSWLRVLAPFESQANQHHPSSIQQPTDRATTHNPTTHHPPPTREAGPQGWQNTIIRARIRGG